MREETPSEEEVELNDVGRANTSKKAVSSKASGPQMIVKPTTSNPKNEETQDEEEGECGGVKKSEVKMWLKEGLLVFGPPPKDSRNFRSQVYTTGGIQFLFWHDTGDEFENWFGCQHYDWVNYVLVGNGTTGLTKHAKTHAKEVRFEIKIKRSLAELRRVEQYLPNAWLKFDEKKFFQKLKKFANNGAGTSQQMEPQKSKQEMAIERARAKTAAQNNSTKKGNYFQ